NRLKGAVAELAGSGHSGGYIIRTAAHGAPESAIREDLIYLDRLWQHVAAGHRERAAPGCVHEDLPLAVRLVRDERSTAVERIRVDSAPLHARMREFAVEFMPAYAERIELYEGPRPLFDLHDVEREIDHALERKVPLKSGGHLVFDQTESMTTIDVNTGAY